MSTSTNENENSIYINKKTLKGRCPRSMTYLRFVKPAKFIKYFVSDGKKGVRGGNADYLKASPGYVEKYLKSLGKIRKIGNNLVIQKCEKL